jgi:hypothetical protein
MAIANLNKSKCWSERGIQLMQILGLLSMYFNAVLVFVKKNALSDQLCYPVKAHASKKEVGAGIL